MKQEFIEAARQFSQEYRKQANKDKTTLFLGDSFFDKRYFWTDFDETFAGKDAFCAGISSTTTYEWEEVFPKYFAKIPPKNLVVNIGTNNFYDAFDSAQTAQKNLKRLLFIFRDGAPDAKIFYFAVSQRTDGRFEKEVSLTNAALKEWCAQNGIVFLDTEKAMTAEKLRDGVHPLLHVYKQVYVPYLMRGGCVMENLSSRRK